MLARSRCRCSFFLRPAALAAACALTVSCGGGGDSTAGASPDIGAAEAGAAASEQFRRAVVGETTVVINPPPVSPKPATEGGRPADPEHAARSSFPVRIAVDGAGNLYLTQHDKSVRKITPAGVVTLLPENAGAIAAGKRPGDSLTVAADSAGNLHVADTVGCTVRKITPEGRVTTTSVPGPRTEQGCSAMRPG